MAEIRRIRVDEAPLVGDLVRLATEELAARFPEDEIGISEGGLSNLETQFRISAVHEDELTLVAVEREQIIGFISAWITRGRASPGVAAELDWLWVRPGDARQGVERQLAEAAVSWLRERGAGPIFKMEDAQHPQREPWEALGFEPDVIRYSLYEPSL
jgi:GNAT superfamily N-acetyltransferase